MSSNPPCVFIDANVLIQAGKPPGGPLLNRVRDLAKAGLIRLITTDLTILEVAKRHTHNDYELISEFGRPHVRRALDKATGFQLPELSKEEIREALWQRYFADTKAMTSGLGCETLSINDVKPLGIFTEYTHGQGLFGPTGKKDQFPDAFIFARVKQLVDDETHLIIVARDGDYTGPSGDETHIQLVESVPELFTALGLQEDAPQIAEFLENNSEDLVLAVDKELDEWGLIGDIQDSEVEETSVQSVEVKDLVGFGSLMPDEPILAVATLDVSAIAYYSHPDWDHAMYDSEDKVLIPFEHVQGSAEVTFEVDVSFEIGLDDQGVPETIDSLSFRNSNFQFVELQDNWQEY